MPQMVVEAERLTVTVPEPHRLPVGEPLDVCDTQPLPETVADCDCEAVELEERHCVTVCDCVPVVLAVRHSVGDWVALAAALTEAEVQPDGERLPVAVAQLLPLNDTEPEPDAQCVPEGEPVTLADRHCVTVGDGVPAALAERDGVSV